MKRTVTAACALCLSAAIACAASDIRLISHRGESGSFPENTMAAFSAAVELGANGFECDVRLTSDNEIVCIHDATTARTTDGDLTVAESALAQLQALDAGTWKNAQFAGERIPTLSEALTLARDGFEIYVDIKCGVEIMPRLIEVIATSPDATPARVVFTSPDKTVVAALRQQFPAFRAYWVITFSTDTNGLLTPYATNVVAELQAMDAAGVITTDSTSKLDATYVKTVRQAGLSFTVKTINSQSRAAVLAAMGAGAVLSDYAASYVPAVGGIRPAGVTPVVHWTFEDGMATNCGTGGPAYDANLTGAVVFTNGIDGGGLYLPRDKNSYAAVNYTLGDRGTIALWYNFNFFYSFNTVFDNSADADHWEMYTYDGGTLHFRVGPNNSAYVAHNMINNQNSSNHWYHIALSWDKDSGQTFLYVNGIEVARGTRSAADWAEPGSTIYFGGRANTSGHGLLDDVRIYDDKLTAAQIQAVHAETASKKPVVHIMLDGSAENLGTGGALFDATLNGEPAWTNGVNNKGLALALDGSNDYVEVSYRLPMAGSVALWYKPNSFYNYNSVFDNSVNQNHWETWIDVNSNMNFRCRNFQMTAGYSLRSLRADKYWYHVTATWNALNSNITFYVNGVLRGTTTDTNVWERAGNKFFVGGGHDGNGFGHGDVSDVQIFETQLPPSRVQEVFEEAGLRGGLVAYLPFDGSAVDVAGNHTVAVNGAPVYENAQIGKGIRCDGTNDNIAIENVLNYETGTIAMWHYTRSPWYNYQTLFDNASHEDRWECWIYFDGRFAFRVNSDGSGDVRADLSKLRGADSWYHVAVTWDNAVDIVKLYIDGVLMSTDPLGKGWIDPDPTLWLAGVKNSKSNGVWDEVRVYDRALTTDEVEALMVIPPPPPPKGTLLLMK